MLRSAAASLNPFSNGLRLRNYGKCAPAVCFCHFLLENGCFTTVPEPSPCAADPRFEESILWQNVVKNMNEIYIECWWLFAEVLKWISVPKDVLETSFLIFQDAFERGMRTRGFDENTCIYCIEWTLARPLAAKLLRDLHCKAFKNIIKKGSVLFVFFDGISSFLERLSGTILGSISLFFGVLTYVEFLE